MMNNERVDHKTKYAPITLANVSNKTNTRGNLEGIMQKTGQESNNARVGSRHRNMIQATIK